MYDRDLFLKALESKGYKARYFATGKEAADYVCSQVKGCTVGFGGSATIEELDLVDRLAENNTCFSPEMKYRPKELTFNEAALDTLRTDVFLLSVNGAAEDGTLVNIDGTGNRVGSSLFGHKKVYFIFSENNMSVVDMATSSFGQGFSCTMIQMAASYCSLINGGYYYQPRIVSRILDENGGVVKTFEPVLIRKTVTQETSDFLRMAALHTVDRGIGDIPGYSIGGKTGTANKYPIEEDQYVGSFMAFVPAESPSLLIYVVIDEPANKANTDAIEIERNIMRELLEYRGIQKTNTANLTTDIR